MTLPDMNTFIYGAGGLGREVLAALLAQGLAVRGFVVDSGFDAPSAQHGLPIANCGLEAIQSTEPASSFVLAVGDSSVRRRAARQLVGAAFTMVRHPAVNVGTRIRFGEGAMLIGPANFTTDIDVGAHALVNPGCHIAHDCRLGAFCSLGPSVALAGNVTVGEGAFLGVGAKVLPGITIGAWAVVGAGAVVTRDVAPGVTVVGVPAAPIRHRG